LLGNPARVDPAIASLVFAAHLDRLWQGPLPSEMGLTRRKVDDLHELVGFRAVRPDSTLDPYYVLLGAEYYDHWPPTAAFVDPDTLCEASPNSRWWPTLRENPAWGALHNTHRFADGSSGQMICISFTAEYYRTQHSPPPDAVWQQGRHTVAATITRIAKLLRQPYYERPSS
jgi:hypothetical protein